MRWNRLWGAFGSCYELDQNKNGKNESTKKKWMNWRTQHRLSIEQRIITPHSTHGSDESTKAIIHRKKNNYCVSFLAFKKYWYMLCMKYNPNMVQKKTESRAKKKCGKMYEYGMGEWVSECAKGKLTKIRDKIVFFPSSTKPFYRSKECVNTYTHARTHTFYCYCTMYASVWAQWH